jgi:hypothetical protein
VELKRDAAPSENPFSDGHGNSVQVSVARKEVILGICDPDEGLLGDVTVGESNRFKE